MIRNRLSLLLPIMAILLLVIGCGQGGNDASDLKQVTGDESPFTLVVEQIAGNSADTAGTAVRHEIKTLKGDVLKVTIFADNAVEMTGAAVVLEYDETRVTPTKALAGDFLGNDPIFFNTMEYAGEVPVAISQYKPFKPVNGHGLLADLYFEKGAFDRSLFETGGMPPAGGVTDLTADFNAVVGEVSLTWSEMNPGDYNQDSRVSGPDVLYLAAHIGEAANPGEPAACCDSDNSGFADTQDLFAIAANYRSEVDGYVVQTSENYTMLGPWQQIDYVERPEMTGSDPSWTNCLPVYGEDTDPLVYTPPFYPFWYKVKAYYQDDSTLEEFTGPDSNFATSQNAIVMQVGDYSEGMDYHNDFGNGDQIWVEITAGEMEDTTAMSLNINFNNEYLDLDPESIVMGDFFGSPNYTLFPPPEGVNDFDLVVWDATGTPGSGTGVVAYFAFDIDVDDQESNIYFGIDPEQGTLFTDSEGSDTQFSATGDDWAMWGLGMHPLHPPKPCFLFNDNFTSEYGTSGWEIGATGSDQDENTGWYLDYTDFCTADASLHWYDPATEPDDAYGDRNDDWIMTPALDLTDYDPEDPEEMSIGISGYGMWELETGFPDPDFVNFEVATYPGYTDWTMIHQFTGVNVPDPDDPEDPEDDPVCPGWTTISISLLEYYGETIKVRMKAHSDFSNPEPMFGFAIENFGVGVLGAGGPGPGGDPHAEILLVDGTGYGETTTYWTTALESLGYSSGTGEDTYTTTTASMISSASVMDPFDVVLWMGGTSYNPVNQSPTYAQNTAIEQYLEGGGTNGNGAHFFVMGNDLLYNIGSRPLATTYLGMTGYSDIGAWSASLATGQSGTAFASASYSWGPNDIFASSFSGAGGGSTIDLKVNNSSPDNIGAENSGAGTGDGWMTVGICNNMPSNNNASNREDMLERIIINYFGFADPSGAPEGWPDICPAADVLPVPGSGEGFGWGGSGGDAPVASNLASIALIDSSNWLYYEDWENGEHQQALEDAGYTEGGSGPGEFEVFNMSSSASPSGTDLEGFDIIYYFHGGIDYYYTPQHLSATQRTAIDNAVDAGASGVFIEAPSLDIGYYFYDAAGWSWAQTNFGISCPLYITTHWYNDPIVCTTGQYLEDLGTISRNAGYYMSSWVQPYGGGVSCATISTWGTFDSVIHMDNGDWQGGWADMGIENFQDQADRQEFMELFFDLCGFDRP